MRWSPFVLFASGFVTGGVCEYLLAMAIDFFEKKPLRLAKKYSLGKKVSLFLLPIWGLIALLFLKGSGSYVSLFIISALIGTFLEGLTGYLIYKIFGVRLWIYNHGKLGQFTSMYSLPYWGSAGLLFVSIGRHLGF